MSSIKNDFETIQREASQAVIRERGIETVTRETLMLMTALSWMAARMPLIKQFLRNILFQIYRNSMFTIIGLAAGAALLLFIIFGLLSSRGVFSLTLDNHNYWFYILFAWLLWEYSRYLGRAMDPITESIIERVSQEDGKAEEGERAERAEGGREESQYDRYHLEYVGAMSGIMRSYAAQLDQLRTRFRPGDAPASQ
jgi:hypothetical protein